MRKIAFVGAFNNCSVNGTEYASFLLAKHLVEAGVDIYIYYEGGKPGIHTDNLGIHHRIFTHFKMTPGWIKNVKNFLISNPDNVDVFHFHSAFIPFHYVISLVLKKKSIPYVITPHGAYIPDSLFYSRRKLLLLKSFYSKLLEKQMAKNADALIAVTDKEADDFKTFGYSGQIETIPNPAPNLNNKRSSTPHVPHEEYILYLGRFDIYFKGLFFLINTFKLLQKKHPHLQLVLHGEGTDEAKIKKYIHRKNLKNISIKSPVYGEEKERIIKNCLLYFQPSRWEAFGMSVMEAMILGKPVVVTDKCYLSKLLLENAVGRVVPFEPERAVDIIEMYLEFLKQGNNEAEQLKKVAMKEFEGQKVATKTIRLYEEILQRYNQLKSRKKYLLVI